jgi:hypothetical protein
MKARHIVGNALVMVLIASACSPSSASGTEGRC